MKVGDAMTSKIEAVNQGETLRKAARLMADLGCEALPVGETTGWSARSPVAKSPSQIVSEGRDPERITVRQAMSSDVLYCFEDESPEDVSEKMGGWWIRRLPVVSRDKRLVGSVSLGDLTLCKTGCKTGHRTALGQAAEAIGSG